MQSTPSGNQSLWFEKYGTSQLWRHYIAELPVSDVKAQTSVQPASSNLRFLTATTLIGYK